MNRWTLVATVGAGLIGLAAVVSADKKEDSYIKVEMKGILETGLIAIGGETTGTTLTVTFPDGANVIWELDLGNDPALQAQAEKLDKKPALVTGTYSKKKGVEIKERHIVKVTSLKAP